MQGDFFTDKGFSQLGKNIYVYRNFLNNDELALLLPVFDKFKNDSMFEPSLVGTSFENRVSIPLKELETVLEKARSLIGSEFSLHPSTSVNVMREGDHWGQHSDNHDFIEKRKLSSLLRDGDPYDIVQDTKYGLVVYFNEVELGGELYYSRQDITYQPSPGDMVIHGAEEDCMHGVNKILLGYRYSYSNFLSKEMKVPAN